MSIKAEKVSFYILSLVIFISPALSLFSAMALVPLFVIAGLLPVVFFVKSIENPLTRFLKDFLTKILRSFSFPSGEEVLRNHSKLLTLFLIYSAISTFWAIDYKESISMELRLVMLCFVGYILFDYTQKMDEISKGILLNLLVYGFILAIALINIEVFTGGVITSLLNSYKRDFSFHIVLLNRGSTYISLLLWIVFAYLFKTGKKFLAGIILLITFISIFVLDSQSAMLGLFVGIIAYILSILLKKKFYIVASAAIVLVTISAPIAAYNIQPEKIVSDYNIPVTAAHRLYIWNFAAKKAYEKKWFGWGFNSARSVSVEDSDMIKVYCYNDNMLFVEPYDGAMPCDKLSPLPLHPHNLILQIWLELGIFGLLIFALFNISVTKYISRNYPNNLIPACFAVYSCYMAMSSTAYGIWQNWWIVSAINVLFLINMLKNRVVW